MLSSSVWSLMVGLLACSASGHVHTNTDTSLIKCNKRHAQPENFLTAHVTNPKPQRTFLREFLFIFCMLITEGISWSVFTWTHAVLHNNMSVSTKMPYLQLSVTMAVRSWTMDIIFYVLYMNTFNNWKSMCTLIFIECDSECCTIRSPERQVASP